MGSRYVPSVFHARGETQGNYACSSRGHVYLNSIPSIQKMACTMAAGKDAMFMGCLDLNQQHTRSLLSSSWPSVLHMVPASPISILATKHFTKCSSTNFPPQRLANPTAPIKATQSSSTSPTNHGEAPLTLSEQWREIQGEKHWEGLLAHPLDPALRAEIIRYGEFAQVCYDAFDFNQHSLYCGSCKYNRRDLFEKVDKGGCGYEVTKYLYATSKLDLPKFFKKSERDEKEKWSRDSNWIGYVAVCTDEAEVRRIGRRDILIAWRGTVTRTEWVDDLMTTQAPANIEIAMSRPRNGPFLSAPSRSQNTLADVKPMYVSSHDATAPARHDRPATTCNGDLSEVVKVESGFLSLYSSSKASSRFNKLSAGQQVAVEVKRLLQKYEGEEISISITGHSLGAALALLCAYDIAANVAARPPDAAVSNTTPPEAAGAVKKAGSSSPLITVFSFAGPRVGNRAFRRRVEELGVRVLRIVNQHDCVPKVPGVLFNEQSPEIWPNSTGGYHHVGKELLIDFDFSPHLRHTRDLPSHHNLEAHLHVLDGFHGFKRPFQSVFGRNPNLVNKSSDFLQKEAFIPPFWWQEHNKGLVKDPLSGQWVLASREEDHLPEIHHP